MGGGAAGEGSDAREKLFSELYSELRRRAARAMRGQPKNGSLQPTALVHEACLKIYGNELFGSASGASADRSHLLALACTAMRSVLVDHARARQRAKRTAPGQRLPLDAISVAFEENAVDLLSLHDALERLSAFDAEMARAVDLAFFGGLSLEETAQSLGVPMRTFERRWAVTKAWLRAEIR